MSIRYDRSRRRYVVRWYEGGKRRVRRFVDEAEARAFAATVSPSGGQDVAIDVKRGDGVYAYETKDGPRYRFSFRQADGTLSTRRGFTSRRAAVTARRRLVESIARGEVKPARETFGEFWTRYLEERQPYLTAGTLIDYETHGRKRLLPAFGSRPLVRIDEGVVRRWMRAITAEADAAGISRKTVNNARTCLTVALNEAVRQGLVPRNPCLGVPALPAERQELEYLRMHENGAELHS